MQIIRLILLFLLIVGFLSISGCINTQKADSTWGEKKLSMETIKILNRTVGNRSEQNDSIYYVTGYVANQNSFEALDVKLKVTTYYQNGTVFAINNTPYIDPKNIPSNGKSYFYARFEDPDKRIAKYEVNILSAKGEL